MGSKGKAGKYSVAVGLTGKAKGAWGPQSEPSGGARGQGQARRHTEPNWEQNKAAGKAEACRQQGSGKAQGRQEGRARYTARQGRARWQVKGSKAKATGVKSKARAARRQPNQNQTQRHMLARQGSKAQAGR